MCKDRKDEMSVECGEHAEETGDGFLRDCSWALGPAPVAQE